ncbi:NAD(P)-dependent dehydrogenase (short-subunit alcohol dehydrogenase family) [Silvibacterium bohemicum]|uniref:NAD(P)-dependent dehydrogenase (Short-subunit alcohol dehydrogenase family) n=1 Tax=Silvibacterium bohemicum TaxID=1577686 RepID=A0A841JS67_9BACT|nr:glucose 1-dehydrogenase [Silvibacterium bohemicum]MBB6144253.1 NAD(P)-dependent dehydrogenase (short-subunit alcohol dehydrogenase family) [Silvibacterium bohemicum]
MGKLANKVAVITGGNSGIGLATAEDFVAEGAYVFITGRRQKELDEAVKKIGKNVTAVQGDVSNLADLDRLYAQVAKEKGRVDIVFANAGIGFPATLDQVTEQQFDQTFNINLRGLMFTVQKALPLMSNGGAILLCGSNASQAGVPGFTVYSATKAAVRSFARTWTAELAPRKIRVNVISPGPIETPIWNSTNLPKEVVAQIKGELVSKIPAGVIGEAVDVAKAASFLASEDSKFIQGVELFVDGGMSSI